MTLENIIRAFAGTFILLSLALGVQGSPLFLSANWLWFTAFVGVNLLQSSVTHFCPLEIILKKLGIGCASCDAAPSTHSAR